MPAAAAFILSVSFLCVAVSDPSAGSNPEIAAPVGILAIFFMVWQVRKDRSRT